MDLRFIKLQIFILLTFLSLFLTSCMVGPNFRRPPNPQVDGYTEKTLPAKTASIRAAGKGGIAQRYVREDIPAAWWALFQSEVIDSLIRQGIANSPNLAAAQATLRQAQETLAAQVGSLLLPAVDANISAERQKLAGATFNNEVASSIFNLYNASVSVSYTPDIFGGSSRQIESLQAQVDYQQFQLIATYLTLTANIVTTAITVASLEAQISATKQLISEQEAQLKILRDQFRLGGTAGGTVLTQETLVEQTRATLPALEKSLSQSRHALSVLVGKFPNNQIPSINLDQLTLPKKIPVSLPANLVRQRPDVRAAEATLHSASAQIGVATANLYPQLNLTGVFGWTADSPSQLFRSNNSVWDMLGQVTQPIFRGGALRANRRAAIAAYDVALAQYKQIVLQAFQNVADALRAIETDARALRAQKRAEIAAKENVRLSEQQYQLGGVDYLTLLNAQQQYQQTRISRIQAQAARYADTAALFQALGGGWWNRQLTLCHDPINPSRASLNCP